MENTIPGDLLLSICESVDREIKPNRIYRAESGIIEKDDLKYVKIAVNDICLDRYQIIRFINLRTLLENDKETYDRIVKWYKR